MNVVYDLMMFLLLFLLLYIGLWVVCICWMCL